MPVSVIVRTVVVRSGTPSLRTVALRRPMARAVRAMTAYVVPVASGAAKATTDAAPTSTASAASVARAQVRRDPPPSHLATRPPITAPARKQPSDAAVWDTEKPGAPAAAKPSTTTLPVMLAVKTWWSPR